MFVEFCLPASAPAALPPSLPVLNSAEMEQIADLHKRIYDEVGLPALLLALLSLTVRSSSSSSSNAAAEPFQSGSGLWGWPRISSSAVLLLQA